MHLLVRLTVFGVFAVAGLSLAVSVCLQPPATLVSNEKHRPLADVQTLVDGHDSTIGSSQSIPDIHDTADASPENSGAPQIATEGARSSAAPTSPATISPLLRDSMGKLLETAMNRWTAPYLPPRGNQFEELDQVIKGVKKKGEQEPPAAERNDSSNATPTDSPAANSSKAMKGVLPPPQQTTPSPLPEPGTLPTLDSKPSEVRLDAGSDLVSINAPNSDIREVFKTLSDAAGINILATRSVTGSISVSLNNVDVNTALGAILKSSGFASRREGEFLYVGTTEELQKMSVAGDKVGTRVYRPNYVTASELQKLITSMLSPDVGAISVSTAAEVGIASGADKAGGDSYSGGDVVVVRDFETVLERIDQVFEEIDRMPRQVMIEAMILSVKLDDENTIGVNFELLRDKANIRIVSGGTATSLAGINFSDGLKVGFLDESLFAFLNALETIGDTNVIASPRVMCLNKQRAEILIGSELGYVSTTVTETAATQSVEFLEVGTHLRIRPYISNDGMVRLEVHPELSTGTVRVDQGFTLPDKEVTQVTTNVMCRSNSTVIIGGLIREDLIATSQQIPVLGNLPFLGPLFRERTENTERREIIVLLTPRIIEDYEAQAEGEKSFTEFRDRRNAFYDKFQPTNKRRIGERYGRLALSAWAAGEASVALRYANLAIHYDPLHQDAINLRQEILSAYPDLENNTREHLTYGLWPWQHPAHDYTGATGWPWREIGLEPKPAPVVSDDHGTVGPIREIISDRPRVKR